MNDAPERLWLWPSEPEDGVDNFVSFPDQPFPRGSTEYIRADIARADAVPADLAEAVWKPIETAPKDGTEILCVFCNDYGYQAKPTIYGPWTVAFRRGQWMASWDDTAVIERETYAGTEYKTAGVDPTHWMPIPAPPPVQAPLPCCAGTDQGRVIMTDEEMIERQIHAAQKRDGFDAVYLASPAADRIEALTAERDALKVAQIDAIRAALDAAIEKIALFPERIPADPRLAYHAALDAVDQHIRAIDPAAIAAKLKGDGDDR